MTRADTAERTLIYRKQSTEINGTGSMLSNITVNYLHYGIFYQHIPTKVFSLAKYDTWKNIASDMLIYISLVSVLSSVLFLLTPSSYISQYCLPSPVL